MPAKYGLTTAKPARAFHWLYLPFLLLLGLESMVLATPRIAAFWNYQPALGKSALHRLQSALVRALVGPGMAKQFHGP
ncbi:MAG: hypothetical protein LBS65_10250 [Desulfovibrio sp.]|jgi:hypothetical protein|nr:hypothetical protein [Desulfovibrio sp.]